MATLPNPKSRKKWYLGYMWIPNFMIICGPLSIVYFGTDTIILKIGVAAIATCVAFCYLIRVTDNHMGRNLRLREKQQTKKVLIRIFQFAPIAMIASTITGMAEGISAKILPIQAYTLGFNEHISAFAVTIFGAGNLASMIMIAFIIKKIAIKN